MDSFGTAAPINPWLFLPPFILLCVAIILAVNLFKTGRGIRLAESVWVIASIVYFLLGIDAVLSAGYVFLGLLGILIVDIFDAPIPSYGLFLTNSNTMLGLAVVGFIAILATKFPQSMRLVELPKGEIKTVWSVI